jgi:hypothetical protein
MKNISLLLFSLLFFFSCSTEKSEKISKTKIIEKTNQVVANRILELEVEGMVCKMGCGSSIRKEMLATNAVESCEINYEDKRKSNQVKVAFNKDKISADELISKINSMNDKQFKVVNSSSKEFKSKFEEDKTINENSITENSSEESKIKITEKSYQMPNLLSIFSRLLTR